MKILVLLALVQVFSLISSKYLTAEVNEKAFQLDEAGGNVTMINLGNVDGKSYFFEHRPLTWTASRDLCHEYGMKLATIKTAAQFAFLKSKYNSSSFGVNKWYWVAARDSKQARALSWDDTNAAIDPLPTGLYYGHYVNDYQICAKYADYGSSQYIQGYSCSFSSSSSGILCET